ncbi:Probable type I restriction enzyme BthVORF4518P M protein [Mycoplasmopsis californica]|uniref:site-specific DNA-methyltransferase (adenine-specific) n=1 Tax=Mycoplasmopsis equigenitalium TaxID=114883 RepID=A0ABY5J2Q3_9BACT|nr:N-6 DNA methylase [Mycoplasmopsis equigenitalium]UUD36806.1 SAM-dependent methyltransferase [Mycoplasmopsis equigenitalium]VEU69896.1 Probable type I restriction enzyme BthVORF4518P M protein [Mycoplasmopsis californica]
MINSNNNFDIKNLSLEAYKQAINKYGIDYVWSEICNFVLKNGENDLLKISNFGELYEIALAIENKNNKKKQGKYYTPDDIGNIMSQWLDSSLGENICDVGCGTGNLILNYLDFVGGEKTHKLLKEGKIYLYDFDKTAIQICKTSLLLKYGKQYENNIHCIQGDFLDKNIHLPKNAKVISNPPYSIFKQLNPSWEVTENIEKSKELYAAFMEKCFKEATSAIFITPFTFVSGLKFYALRKSMSELGSGFIICFDNVPGNIFNGRKHGIFNSNTANSVRAAITVFTKSSRKGFRISPLIRFKNNERHKLLNCEILENELNDTFQIVNKTNPYFKKIDKELVTVFKTWNELSKITLKKLITQDKTPYVIDVPNTCRYYTTGSSRKLNRTGSIILNVKNEVFFSLLYCLLNSSLAYFWWRIYDGGITYPVNLLKSIPIPIDSISSDDFHFFKKITKEMIEKENEFLISKMNAGNKQENIKFPIKYRKLLNERFLKILDLKLDINLLEKIHKNSYFNQD